ncbi:MAG: antibiotic biosynthesis monooxygenase [Chloroflexota bacterium]|nr:antibiotic biosynthesis monooxygenase [Chloroflexota bacterium]
MTIKLTELDSRVTFGEQLERETGPVVLINTFTVDPDEEGRLLAAWTDDAAFMQDQPGFISTRLHRGIAGSSAFVNVAEWDSAQSLRAAFFSPGFQDLIGRYPDSAVATPHLFVKVAVPGIRAAEPVGIALPEQFGMADQSDRE